MRAADLTEISDTKIPLKTCLCSSILAQIKRGEQTHNQKLVCLNDICRILFLSKDTVIAPLGHVQA